MAVDHQTAVAENRAALLATIEFGIRKLEAPKWEPAADSEAAAELVNTETRADGSPWGEELGSLRIAGLGVGAPSWGFSPKIEN